MNSDAFPASGPSPWPLAGGVQHPQNPNLIIGHVHAPKRTSGFLGLFRRKADTAKFA